jgi:hypothetical protein
MERIRVIRFANGYLQRYLKDCAPHHEKGPNKVLNYRYFLTGNIFDELNEQGYL